MIGTDLHHWQRWRQRAARHDVLGLDHFLRAVEVDEVAAQYVHGSHREAGLLAVDQRKIDEFEQRFTKGGTVVVAGRSCCTRQAPPRTRKARLEEARLPRHRRDEVAGGVARLAEDIA